MTKKENEKEILLRNDDKTQQSKWVNLIDYLITVSAYGVLLGFISFILVAVVIYYNFVPNLLGLFFLIWIGISFIIPVFLFSGTILHIIKYVIVRLDKKANQAA
ncbi:MAG: hypothetical protein IJ881_08260 [Neisseriaceae bacterium]|nr:hypothetical protein [Neisseriaceae bacterium]